MKSLLFLLFFCFYEIAGAKVLTVKIEAMKFSPKVVEAQMGDTIQWDNKDFFPHTATALDKSFDSGSIHSQSSWSYVLKKKGTLKYKCTLHSDMTAAIVVH